ncbi:MAG: hypothetical protein ACHQ4F_01365 [Candidatus Dormibacteria bacterium]
MTVRVMRRLVRVAFAVPVLALGLGAVSSVARTGPVQPLCAHASFSHRAGLVVEHGDGQVIRRCVGFDASTATALEVLQASGLEVAISSYGGSFGAAICQIDNEPATYPPGCFSTSGSYWVLFVSRGGGAWATSDLGVSNVTVNGGDDIGFRYDSQTGTDPPPPSPAGTCPAVTPPPTRTPTQAVTPTSSAHAQAGSSAAPTSRRATPASTTTPTAGVLGIATPEATPKALATFGPATNPPGVDIGLLLAAIGAGGLVGLLGTRALRRRRE